MTTPEDELDDGVAGTLVALEARRRRLRPAMATMTTGVTMPSLSPLSTVIS